MLQDITVLNGNDASKLEDWLTDIEAASDLTDESRTKLAQAKSKGLIRTLISEALTSNKTWEEIKDSLHLKICNSDIQHICQSFYGHTTKRKMNLWQLMYTTLKRKLAGANSIMMQPQLGYS